MGLEDFSTGSGSNYEKYGNHEYDSKLGTWADEMQQRFPIDLNIEFVEVSPQMTKTRGMAYKRNANEYYIRISERFIHNHSDERVKLTLLHEMVHVYFYQQGFSDTKHDKYFRWVVGRVGASMTHMTLDDKKWEECIEPFIEDDERWD